MDLMDTKYNLRRKEITEMPGLGYPWCQIEPGGECREGDGWNGVIITVSGKDCLSQSI